MSRSVVAALAAAAALAGSLAWGKALGLEPVDDAFITFRAATHWAEGLGPVFNEGERVESATSPLWTGILALVARAGVSPPQSAPPLGLLFAAAAGALAALVALELSSPGGALVCAVVLAALPSWSSWPLTAMEVPLASALLAAAALAVLRGKPSWAGALAGLSALARPEGLVFAAGVVLVLPRGRLRAAALATLPIAALFLARFLYFGEWLPNTYVAKRGGLGTEAVVRGLVYVAGFALVHAGAVSALVPALVRAGKARQAAILVLCFGAAVAYDGGDHFPASRLAAPALPLLYAVGAAELVRLAPRIRAAAAALAAAALLLLPDLGTFQSARWWARLGGEAEFVQRASEAGAALRAAPPGRVACVSIGAVGWYSGRAVLDLVGLADRRIARSPHLAGVKPGHDHSDVDYVLAQRPELVLLIPQLTGFVVPPEAEHRWLLDHRDFFLAALLLVGDDRFRAAYRAVDVALAGGRHLRLWARNDLKLQ